LRLEPAGLRVRAPGHEGHVTLDVGVDASEKLPLAGMEWSAEARMNNLLRNYS
jgi:hypothetical protein